MALSRSETERCAIFGHSPSDIDGLVQADLRVSAHDLRRVKGHSFLAAHENRLQHLRVQALKALSKTVASELPADLLHSRHRVVEALKIILKNMF